MLGEYSDQFDVSTILTSQGVGYQIHVIGRLQDPFLQTRSHNMLVLPLWLEQRFGSFVTFRGLVTFEGRFTLPKLCNHGYCHI